MGVQAAPGYIADPTFDHPAELDRNILEGIFTRTGAVEPGDFMLSVGVGTRAIAVAGGRYSIEGTENATQGSYFVWSDAAETSLLAAAVGNPRIDSFILRVIDNQYGSIGGSPRAEIEVVQGVAAGSPTARPDSDFQIGGPFYQPGAWARLGDVRVNVADTGSIPAGQITNFIRLAGRRGASFAGTLAQRPNAGQLIGDRYHEYDTGFQRYWNGSAWQQAAPWTQTVILGSNAAQIDLTSIPTTLRQLKVTYSLRSSVVGNFEQVNVRVNASSATNYNAIHYSAGGAGAVNATTINGGTGWAVGFVPGANITANFFGAGVLEINNWSGTSSSFPMIVYSTGMANVGQHWKHVGNGTYHTAGPYTSLRISPDSGGANWITGSWVRLEGWE